METVEDILRNVGEVLVGGTFNNVSILCGDGVEVKSNSVLLASISPWIYKLMLEQNQEEHITLVTPDINSGQLKNLINKIVALFLKKNSLDPYCDASVLMTLFLPTIKNMENKIFQLPNCSISQVDVKEESLPDALPEIVKLEKDETNGLINTVSVNEENSNEAAATNDFEMLLDSDSSNSVEQSQKVSPKKKQPKTNRVKAFKCDQCTKFYANQKALDKHRLVHGEGEKFSCNVCNKVYLTQKELLLHLGRHNPLYPPSTKKRMTREEFLNSFPSTKLCIDCGKEFKNTTKAEKRKYFDHIFQHKVDNFKCDCDVPPFKCHFEKKRHMRVKHLGWHQCPKCMKYFGESHLLEKHILQVHSEQARVVCEICGHSNSNQMALKKHMKGVHSGIITKCKECDKEFNGEANLSNHVRNVHRTKQCPHCSKYFKEVGLHIKTMHTLDKDKKCQCKSCGKGFRDKTALRKHELSVHKIDDEFKDKFSLNFRLL